MKAYRCDRCGGFFEKKQKSDIRIERRIPRNGSICCLDFCEACQKQLENWLNVERNKEE